MTGAFDALATAEALKAAGMQDAHAKAIAGAMRDAVTESVATRADIVRLEAGIARLESKIEADITRLETKIEADIVRLEGKIEAEIGQLEAEMGRLDGKIETAIANARVQMMAFMVAVGGAIVAAVKLIP